MKKKVETNNFNTGKYLACVYPFLNLTVTKADHFNSVLSVFLTGDMRDYEIDKSSVSRLASHEYDITKRVKRVIIDSDNELEAAFKENLLCGSTAEEAISRRPYEEMKRLNSADSSGRHAAFASFEKGEFGRFLFLSFKCAVASSNLPERAKMKTGRQKKGSFQSVFFLSEEEKASETDRLRKKLLRSNDRLSKDDFGLMGELIAYAGLSFSDKEKEEVALRFLKRWHSEGSDDPAKDFLWRLECLRKTYGEKNGFLGWERPAEEAAIQIALAPLPAAYRKAVRQSTYAEARRVLEAIRQDERTSSSKRLKELLINNEFFLPDFDGHITESLWGYCRAIAQLSRKAGCSEEFLSKLAEIEKRSPRTATMESRIEALRATTQKG